MSKGRVVIEPLGAEFSHQWAELDEAGDHEADADFDCRPGEDWCGVDYGILVDDEGTEWSGGRNIQSWSLDFWSLKIAKRRIKLAIVALWLC